MMSKYSCEKCLKEFILLSKYNRHLKRKTSCKIKLNGTSVKNTDINTMITNKTSSKVKVGSKKKNLKINVKFNKLKFIDLFSGIGGFHQALTHLGCECVCACDIDKHARETYENNYNIKPTKDVLDLDPAKMPDFDIICAGFPCQPFSNGGKKKTFDDERGLLFDEIIRIAKVKKPRLMFLENVKHILKVSNGEVIAYIKKKIKDAGYVLQIFQISPHQYGIPQQRERVFFVCVRNDIYNDVPIVLPEYSGGPVDFTKFLEKKEDIDEKYFISGDILKVLEAWDEMIQVFEVDEKISPTILINDAYRIYTDEEFENLSFWRKDYMMKNKRIIKKYQKQFDVWYEKHKELLLKREIYGKLEWQVGKIKPNDSIFNYFIQPRQSGLRIKKAKYFPTLVAIVQTPIYGKEKRHITPRECARLQSFPESFKLHENDRRSYKQFGNSVNVHNVSTIISSTFKHYSL
jgi:DNA (cytosine-5)-methyltransferase 1